MKREEIFKTLSTYKKDLERAGYKVIYIGLYGSQNYNLDDELSDVDCRAIIMPSLHDIIFRKSTSCVIEYDTGAVDVKDIITYYDVIKKGNFSFIEPIQSDYYIGDKYIKGLFSQFKPNPKAIFGAMMEKRKALTHEYPSKHEEFEKWGCDPKQYHHILRLYDLLIHESNYHDGISYLSYDGDNRDLMVDFKRNHMGWPKEWFEEYADRFIEKGRTLLDQFKPYESTNIDVELNDYIEKELKKELFKSGITSAREVRTFNNPVPKDDLAKFEELKQYKGQDISYIVYETLEIL